MRTQDLKNALRFLEKVWVGKADEEVLFFTIAQFRREIAEREKQDGSHGRNH
jgi:hypothetical protein